MRETCRECVVRAADPKPRGQDDLQGFMGYIREAARCRDSNEQNI